MHMPPWWGESGIGLAMIGALGYMGKRMFARQEKRAEAAAACAAEDRELLKQLAKAEARAAVFETSLSEVQDELERIRLKLSDVYDKLEALRGDNAAIAAEKSIISDQLTEAKVQIVELKKQVIDRDERIDDLEAETARLNAELLKVTLGGEP